MVLSAEKNGPVKYISWHLELVQYQYQDCKLLRTLVLICCAVITNKELHRVTYTHMEIPVLLDVVDVCLKKQKVIYTLIDEMRFKGKVLLQHKSTGTRTGYKGKV